MLNKDASEPIGTEAIMFSWEYSCLGTLFRQRTELFQAFEDKGIGFVNDGGIKTGEIDLGCSLAVVAHAFGDD